MLEVTAFTKNAGPLTKQISLVDGVLKSDGSACIMPRGKARRARFEDLKGFASFIASMPFDQALALGKLRSDIADPTRVTTKEMLRQATIGERIGQIARTADYISYDPDTQALALIDIDTKGMPAEVRRKITDKGGYELALAQVLPQLPKTAYVVRKSTSAGICREDTGEEIAGSDGLHIYFLISDGSDAERFLKVLHERCWLAGLGWGMVGTAGQFLERSIVDRTVYAAERLVFEGAPILAPPLHQNSNARLPRVNEGAVLDTRSACPDLGIADKARLTQLKAREQTRLERESVSRKTAYIEERVAHAAQVGIPTARTRRMFERQLSGVLTSDIVLPFDDGDLAECRVADILNDPDRFVGATLSDPLEGPEYGRCKAKVMRRSNGDLWIHSFAHGRTTYELRHDFPAADSMLARAADQEIVQVLTKLVVSGDFSPTELARLKDIASRRAQLPKGVINKEVDDVVKEHARLRREAEIRLLAAGRFDTRPQIPAPAADSPWLPQMDALNEILRASGLEEPPMRDLQGNLIEVKSQRAPNMHLLTARGANGEESEDSRLPPPEYLMLSRLTEIEASEMIERYVNYVDSTGRSVHLHTNFVRHYLARSDNNLPIATAICSLPVVMPDGEILAGAGLDRERGVVFRTPPSLRAFVPGKDDCDSRAVGTAMEFLTDDWLCDVKAGYAGKCVAIAMAATLIERIILGERPAFFISAGQRGGGKTTLANMVATAVLGERASAAAWSSSEEERRKALLAYLDEGVPMILWDNIPRGESVSCSSIEKSLTSSTFSDRLLGKNETKQVAATAVHVFTGNNIVPKGDMLSRSFQIRIEVNRTDPENRSFRYPDVIAWTAANRGRILHALYTVLLGNPDLRLSAPPPAQTRFKAWYSLIGRAVENAALQHMAIRAASEQECSTDCAPTPVSFADMLLVDEAGNDEMSDLGEALKVMRQEWPEGFKAAAVLGYIAMGDDSASGFKAALERASGKLIRTQSNASLSWALSAIVDKPFADDTETIFLRKRNGKNKNGAAFWVETVRSNRG